MSTAHDPKFCVLCLSGGHTAEANEQIRERLAEESAGLAVAGDAAKGWNARTEAAEAEVARQAELLDRVGAQLARWRHIRNRQDAAAEMQAELDREVIS